LPATIAEAAQPIETPLQVTSHAWEFYFINPFKSTKAVPEWKLVAPAGKCGMFPLLLIDIQL
jgi:hypothetical protein